jgi:RNA polymerase sigma factor (sigma-70 family)
MSVSAQPNRETRAELAARLDARFRGPLMSFFLRRIGDRAEAEDLTQDTFVRLVAAIEREQPDDPAAFVFKVATNLLRDRGRKVAARAGVALRDIDQTLVSEVTREFLEDRTPERVLLARTEVADVMRALDELGEKVRDVYLLHRLEGLKHKEIAMLYGISVSAVEKHVMKASLHLALRFGGTRR